VTEAVRVERAGAVTTVILDRPAVRNAVDERGSVVVVNGAEGEPDSRKDATLLP